MRAYPWLIVLSVFLLDQTTKFFVVAKIPPGEDVRALPFLNLVHTRNFGALFGFMNEPASAPVFTTLSIAISLLVLLLLLRYRSMPFRVSFSLILGGAFANIWDRLTRGFVVDFLDLHAFSFHWPAFNMADVAITTGVALLCYRSLKKEEGWTRS